MRIVRLAVVAGLGSLLLGPMCGNLGADVARVGGEFQVNTYTTYNQLAPQVSADAAGGFVVVWQSGYYGETGADGSREGISARLYDASGTPAGAEFVANTYTFGPQQNPTVAVGPSGDFVVAWEGGNYFFEQDGSASGVFLQGFTAAGARRGGEQRANTTTAGAQGSPAVAVGSAGDFVVVWASYPSYYTHTGHGDGDGAGVFGQHFDGSGMPVGGEFQVNTYTTGNQFRPKIAADSSGGFVVVWVSGQYSAGQDGSGTGVFGRRLDTTGMPVGGEFQVNTYTTGDQFAPAIAADPQGGFVVTWQSAAADYDTDVFARRFDASAAPLGGEFEVNSFTPGSQEAPSVAVDQGGNFLVVWESMSTPRQDGFDDEGIFGQHFKSTGEPLGNEFQVNSYTPGVDFGPSVAADGNGDFVVVWQSGYGGPGPHQDGDEGGIFGQRFRTTTLESDRRLHGDRLVLTDDPQDPRKRRLQLRTRDAGVQPSTAPADDPTTGGATLRLTSASFDVTYTLPAANWRRRGASGGPPSYEYRDRALISGPITEAVMRSGALRVSGEGAQLEHVLAAANPDPVKVIFRPGTMALRHCMVFGGAVSFTPDKRFRARNSPAPASCR